MLNAQRPVNGVERRILVPVLALAALALTAQAAFANPERTRQAKPQITAEAERSPQGAKIIIKGKGWAPGARVKVTGTRAPGSNNLQDLGMFSADSTGLFTGRKVIACSTNNMEDAQNEPVTFTATDSASGVKATAKTAGGAWVCM